MQSGTQSLAPASPERNPRRLSRLSASEFDSIVNSDHQTIVVAGRDESQLGGERFKASPPLPSSPTRAADVAALVQQRYASRTSPPPSPTKASISRVQYDNNSLAPHSTGDHRRSMARSSSPDLSSSARSLGPPFDQVMQGQPQARSSLDSERSAPPTPTKDTMPDVGAQRRASQAHLAFSARPASIAGYTSSSTAEAISPVKSEAINLPPALDPNPSLPPPHRSSTDRPAAVNAMYGGQNSSRTSLAPAGVSRASMIFVDAEEPHRVSSVSQGGLYIGR